MKNNDLAVNIGKNRDVQLLSKERVIVSTGQGYKEYEITTGQLIKDVNGGNGFTGRLHTWSCSGRVGMVFVGRARSFGGL